MVHINCWYHKMKQLTCIFIYAMLMKILKDKERVFSKQLFWITPFGVKAIRTAGSTADRRRKLPLLIEFEAQIL